MRAAALALPLLAACAMEPAMPASPPTLAGTTWLLERLGDETPPVAVSLGFAGDRVTGEAPCNRYAGAYAQAGAALEIGPVAATRRACPHLDVEARFLSGLTDVARGDVEGDVLILRDEAGAALMRLRRA